MFILDADHVSLFQRHDPHVSARVLATPPQELATTVDIIANKLLRLPAVNSKVVECTCDLHHEIVILFFRISEKVFDNPTSFNPSNDMLNDNPDTGNKTVVLFLFWCKLFPFGLLLR